MKYVFYILILMILKANFIQAQSRDSSELLLKTVLVDAGWLRCWEGVPMMHQNNMEIAGYSTIDKRIRFFKDLKFEMEVYDDTKIVPFIYNANMESCKVRKDGYEVSVFMGTWSVKNDSISLHYIKEKIYDIDKYINDSYFKDYTPGYKSNLKARSSCKLSDKEVYTFRNDKLCPAGSEFNCYK